MDRFPTVAGLLASVLPLLLLHEANAARDTAEVYDLLPAATDRHRAAEVLGKRARVAIRLEDIDPKLVETLRWAVPDPNRVSCESHAPEVMARIETIGRVSPPASSRDLFVTLLEQAEEQFLYVDFQGVLESVREARAVLPCAGGIVERAQLRRLFLFQAVTYLHLGDPRAGETFIQMLSVDPRIYLEPEHPPRVRKAFLEAAERFMEMAPRPIDATGLGGDVFFDGLPVANVAEVRPGAHVVQLEGPGGQVRSQWVNIDPGNGMVRLAPLVDVGLPEAEIVLESLAEALRARSLDRVLARGLDTYLVATGRARVAFALVHDGLVVEIYELGTGLAAHDGDTYGAWFRSPPPWRGLEPRGKRPGEPAGTRASGSGFVAFARVGFGGALSGPSGWGGLIDLSVHRRVGNGLYPGIYGSLGYQYLEGSVGYPLARFGAVVALRVPIGGALAFFPAIGYGVGKGPAVDATCRLEVSGGTESLLCTTGRAAGPGAEAYDAVLVSTSHGPLARLELTLESQNGRPSWSAGIGLQGSYEFVSVGEGRLQSGERSLPYTVEESRAGGVVCIDAVLSFGAAF